jgi:hypothetical protein
MHSPHEVPSTTGNGSASVFMTYPGTGLRLFAQCVNFATPAVVLCPWWPIAPLDSPRRRSHGEGAMTERDLTAREDRLIGLCLAALAIIFVFLFIATTS